MKTQLIKFTHNLKSDPQRDATITVIYDLYHGNPQDAGDPAECNIIRAFDEKGDDVPMEEIQEAAEYEIWQSLKQEREDHVYEMQRERNMGL